MYLTFFMTTKSEKTEELISKEIEKISFLQNINIERNDNTKYKITFTYDNWHKVIYEVSQFSESFGTEWLRTCNIDFELSLWTNKPTLDNVNAIDINVYDIRSELMEN